MDMGFPKAPRHVIEAHGGFVERIRDEYATMIASTSLSGMDLPDDVIGLTWSKKGKPPALTLTMKATELVNVRIVHDPEEPEEVLSERLIAASRLVRIAMRLEGDGHAGGTTSWTGNAILSTICPSILRASIVHHRFGLVRIGKKLAEMMAARRSDDYRMEYALEYRRGGRSSDLIATEKSDTMRNFKIVVKQHAGRWTVEQATVEIADGVSYRYDADRHMILIDGSWPDTMLTTLGGRRLRDVVAHPVLKDCGHVVEEADIWNRRTRLVLSPSFDTICGF